MNASFLWFHNEYPVEEEHKWTCVRMYRNELLSRCDWTQIGDVPFTAEEKNTWTAYRQALRDLPQEFGSPDDVVFPEQP